MTPPKEIVPYFKVPGSYSTLYIAKEAGRVLSRVYRMYLSVLVLDNGRYSLDNRYDPGFIGSK